MEVLSGQVLSEIRLDCTLAATDADSNLEWWTLTTNEPVVGWTGGDWLDIVVQCDVGEDELQLLGSKESTGASEVSVND